MDPVRRIAIAAGAIVISATGAIAADIIEPVYEPAPVVAGGWYLRGDIGMSNQQLHGDLYNVLMDSADTDNFQFLDEGHFSSAPMMRAGIGYEFNDLLRVDATVEYRGKADFSALDHYSCLSPCGDDDSTSWDGTNRYNAKKSEWLIMANGYVDLGTWSGITPYVGGGLGASRVTISDFRDVGYNNVLASPSVAYGGQHSEWNFAWALHAGLDFDVTDRLTLDLGYSYTHLGDGQSGDLTTYTGTNNINNPSKFSDLTSHDLRFGLIYKLY